MDCDSQREKGLWQQWLKKNIYFSCFDLFYRFFGRRQWHPTPVLLPRKSHGWRSLVGCSPWGREESDTTERLHFHALEKEMATHSSVLAWRIPGAEEPGGLPSMGSHRVGHDWSDLIAAAAAAAGFPLHKNDYWGDEEGLKPAHAPLDWVMYPRRKECSQLFS